jgi:DNA-binding MarR family transcriptional regulator
VLDGSGPQTVTQIAERTSLSMGAASQLVDRMVEQKFVERSESADDRRVRIVTIAPAGRSLLRRLHGVRHREWNAALDRLPASVRDRLERVMRDVITALDGGSDRARPKAQ